MANGEKIAVIGAGLVGRAWAIAFARAGAQVALYDSDAAAAALSMQNAAGLLGDLEAHDLLDGQRPEAVLDRIGVAATLTEALRGAAYVQESVAEQVEVKRALFAEIDSSAAPDTVLASSTSFIVPSAIAEGLPGAARILVAHPINPPYLIPAVELVPSRWTEAAAMDRAEEVLSGIGQSVIRLTREVPGFVMNRLQAALLNEAFDLVDQGIASAEAVDAGICDGLGLRWAFMGPFETIDLNAPGGASDYIRRYGGPYREICGETVSAGWNGETLARIERARRDALPLNDIPERQLWRDRRLMALAAHKRRAAGNG